MALCVKQSGTWRNTKTLCVNQSGTWRNILTGCINDSGTWKKFGGTGTAPTTVGSSFGGGRAICLSSGGIAGGIVWIVAPNTTEVSRDWYCRNDAVTTAQANAACGDWFVPTCGQLKNPGYACRTYWDSYSSTNYWSSTSAGTFAAWGMNMSTGNFAYSISGCKKPCIRCVRAFRCVTY